jgi:hypothetical protein
MNNDAGTGAGGAGAEAGSSGGGGATGAGGAGGGGGGRGGGAGGATTTGAGGSGGGTGAHKMAPGGYYTDGPTIRDAAGNAHLFHGVARPSLEWNPVGEHIAASDFALMAGWKANVVRLAMNQEYWLTNTAYPATIDQAIQWAKAAGLDVILDLHWSDKGQLNTAAGQQIMADTNSVTFWTQVATKYKTDGRVMFELYNEPHDVSWDIWRNGGSAGGFQVAGMQQLYDTVRGAGADNLVIIGGLDWAYDLSGVPANRITGYNIVYATHPYAFFSTKQPANWDSGFGFLAATDPVIVTEFGTNDCSTSYYSSLVTYADQHKISWTAWAWYVGGCGFPSVISDWNGTPNAPGAILQAALSAY